MAGILSEIANKVLEEKMRYAQKVTSEDALSQNIFDIYLFSDQIGVRFDHVIFESVFTSLVNMVLFNIEPYEIPIFNLCFETSLPTPEEFAKGKLLDIGCVSCLEKYPELETAISRAVDMLKPSMVGKCYWGESFYGDCYVDPPIVRDYIRSTMLRVLKVLRTGDTQRAVHDSFIENLEMVPEPMKVAWEMSNYVFEARNRDPWWDYAWWDYSVWAEEKSYVETYEKKVVEVDPEHVMDVAGASFWDIAVWDYSYWAEELRSTVEGREMLKKFEQLFNVVMDVGSFIAREAKSRILTTPLLVANYQRADERRNWAISRRVDEFASSKVWVYRIREAVRNIVVGEPPSMFRVYESAAMTLVSRIGRPGGWGYEAFRGMDVNTFKRQWIDEWSGKGLDPAKLEKIFDIVIDLVNDFASERFRQSMMRELLYSGFK